jgi:hypothetical protein
VACQERGLEVARDALCDRGLRRTRLAKQDACMPLRLSQLIAEVTPRAAIQRDRHRFHSPGEIPDMQSDRAGLHYRRRYMLGVSIARRTLVGQVNMSRAEVESRMNDHVVGLGVLS